MVQVDIIWSYAFGASFAAAAARDLHIDEKPFENGSYTFLLHFLAILFAPSGLYLLVKFPQWETMQVAQSLTDLPAWLVTIFAVTNITQGIIGYYIGYRLARRGNFYGAHVNWMVAWIMFWFVLVAGWDTNGWQRFLYDSTMPGAGPWSEGLHMGWHFFASNVFITLFCMGVIFTPMLWLGIVTRNYRALRLDKTLRRDAKPNIIIVAIFSLGTMFIGTLGIAIVAGQVVTLLAHATSSILMGYLLGLPLMIGLGYQLLFRRNRIMHLIARKLYIKEPGEK
jgi:hypothetical protein